ncbi:MAG: arsenate reductase ArsC [Proteobacteria bacterium]|nr:arsenate reductase ArsC [Pseudomonadota bacterium]MDE3209079.1 arsenate reductase ArsC [Pseudomonadota bacterium]
MTSFPLNVLFLCTGNSARSILAEALLNQIGQGEFNAFSAGSQPAGQVHPYTRITLHRHNLKESTLRSKSWDEFLTPGAPKMNFIITVCSSAAQTCPIWPGQAIIQHWNLDDPAAVVGDEERKQQAFEDTYQTLYHHIQHFITEAKNMVD